MTLISDALKLSDSFAGIYWGEAGESIALQYTFLTMLPDYYGNQTNQINFSAGAWDATNFQSFQMHEQNAVNGSKGVRVN